MAETKNRGWIWFFVVLAVLGIAAVGINLAYSWRQQLTPEQLRAARELWDQKGPANYDLVYAKEGSVTGFFRVEVRQGEVRKVLELAKPDDTNGRLLEERLNHYHGMTALFDDLEGFLDVKSKPGGGRIFLTALFAADDGHLISFTYSNPQTQHSIQVNVKDLQRVDPTQ